MAARPNIVFVTTDQQRYDSLGCNGNAVCRTPVVDALSVDGVRYERAHTQNVLCTPSRSTMVTGQHPGTHGVWCNGVALPPDAPSVARVLSDAGYATALIGKIHFEPQLTYQAKLAEEGFGPLHRGPHRGFEVVETVDHFRLSGHYPEWLRGQVPAERFNEVLGETIETFRGSGGDSGAPQSCYSSLEPELHPTTWIVDRTIEWLDRGLSGRPFFVWVSFDDPHHPFNPPAAYGRRHDWRNLALPVARPATREATAADLADKPFQYRAYWQGELGNHEGATGSGPADLVDDQVRELTALTYGMVELIDEQLGRLVAALVARGLDRDTHIFFTTDHGELLGDHGLILKGPFHLDGLMRVPLVWRPAPSAGVQAGVVRDPVGLVDLAPTFCRLAGLPVPEWMEGEPLPALDGSGRERVLTVFDSAYHEDLQLRSVYRHGWLLTWYPRLPGVGELYDMTEDPLQLVNLWDDPARASMRDDLLADLRDHLAGDPREERLKWWTHA